MTDASSQSIRAGAGVAAPPLELQSVHKAFGALKVLEGIDLTLAPGELLGVLGPNGAGKTTLFNLIGGEERPDSGTVRLMGRRVDELPPHRRCRMGLARTYQIPRPFSNLSVFENVLVAGSFGAGRNESHAHPSCQRALALTGLAGAANQRAGALRLLDRKRLELARALAAEPKLLLLDEIAGGLTEHEAAALVELIRGVRATGVTIVWIEHVVHALLAAADRLVVLAGGRLIAQGAPQAVIRDPEVQRVYMGIEVG
ncbi:MAG: ABC transporter ATP-binding protein [Burkholderiales bacterium]|nr:ABC transporter ATP-binding protein [Burkholderiales bacterium]